MEKIKQIKNSLDLFFGENYDFIDVKKLESSFVLPTFRSDVIDYKYLIILKFDNVTVKNRNNLEHNIKDLYILIRLKEDFSITGGIEGCRGELTYAEYTSNYLFSHLSSYYDEHISKCCLGGQTALNQVCMELHCTFNSTRFEHFLFAIKNYVTWESLEGGPYRKIKDIGNNIYSNIVSLTNSQIENYIIPCINKKLHFIIDHDIIEVERDFYNYSIITEAFYASNLPDKYFYCCEYDVKKKLFVSSVNTEATNKITEGLNANANVIFTFKGENVKLKINYIENNNNEDLIDFLSEMNIRNIINILNEYLIEFKIINNLIKLEKNIQYENTKQ